MRPLIQKVDPQLVRRNLPVIVASSPAMETKSLVRPPLLLFRLLYMLLPGPVFLPKHIFQDLKTHFDMRMLEPMSDQSDPQLTSPYLSKASCDGCQDEDSSAPRILGTNSWIVRLSLTSHFLPS